MKKWGCLLFLILGIGFVSLSFFQKEVDIKTLKQLDKSTKMVDLRISAEIVFQGNLVLVNNEYPARKEYIRSDIVHIFQNDHLMNGFSLLNNSIQLSEDITQKFSKMVLAAENNGVKNFIISSGYRNFDEQETLYKEMGADYALPAGFSEHNLGLSLDVGSSVAKMEKAPEGKWIEKNAWKHGFILRYPKDKTQVTGIQYEPWHIRYVGLPHSAIIHEKNFALEEYLDYLKTEKNLLVDFNGKKYQISYYPITEQTTIQVPAKQEYDVSGNNIDGVIVTVYQ
ncbi:VanY-A/VanY-F/VanY-M family D-Ala-D-Ala carboxypeptidase [Bacillus niameyensis]|uniref:VanY-A/VanY-F/VanY-M family D-Ala-D-Ala carboxypeptidase n=1 Tax=Bacillus niameyensis TaxID=1522308 RepID=UPI0007858C1D|nr:VanY-A/VanY-F/VanY-M family D-Ala-D-Ala carboxypeptidase [Bacillus niameyensis]